MLLGGAAFELFVYAAGRGFELLLAGGIGNQGAFQQALLGSLNKLLFGDILPCVARFELAHGALNIAVGNHAGIDFHRNAVQRFDFGLGSLKRDAKCGS